MARTKAAPGAAMRPFSITREFDAPRDLVWKAFTEPERLKHWWGPKGYLPDHCTVDLRPGGIFHYRLRSPEGQVIWGRFVYREVSPQERLVFVVSFSDEDGGMTRHPWSPEWPLEILSTVTFAERDGRTVVTVEWVPHEATDTEARTFDEGRDGIGAGWTGTFDQLDAYLATL